MNIDIDLSAWQIALMALDYAIKIFAVGYVPEGRRPSSSTAWLLAILLIPFVGLPLFLLMGSPYINRRRHQVQIEANETFDDVQAALPNYPGPKLPPEIESVIHLNRELTGFPTVRGVNHGIHADYDETIRAIARAIDRAENYVYVEIYIQSWDETSDVFYQALARARERGVEVKLLLDQIGSFKYKGYSSFGKKLTAIGVDWRLMLPIQLHKARFRRPDLRNHRKIIVIDGKRGFMGSQNIIKRYYDTKDRAWIDYMVEMTGDIVTSMQYIFAVDWYLESDEQLPIEPAVEHTDPDTPGTNLVQCYACSAPWSTTRKSAWCWSRRISSRTKPSWKRSPPPPTAAWTWRSTSPATWKSSWSNTPSRRTTRRSWKPVCASSSSPRRTCCIPSSCWRTQSLTMNTRWPSSAPPTWTCAHSA